MNEFRWMDVKTRDVPGTAAFFEALLGWRFAVDEHDPRRAMKIYLDGYAIGGVSDLSAPIYPPGTPPHVAYYLAVDDADRRADLAVAHGAELVIGPFDVGDQGRIATLVDPAGAAFSLWQAGTFAGWHHSPGLVHAPARMVLACADPQRSLSFYRCAGRRAARRRVRAGGGRGADRVTVGADPAEPGPGRRRCTGP